MWKRIEKPLSVAIVTLAIVACSGASDSGLFASGVQSSSTSTGGSGSSSGSSSSGASSSSGTTSSSSTSGGASGGLVDAGRNDDGGDGGDVRLGPGGDTTKIACGADSCALAGGGRCCVHHAASYTGACATSVATCPAGDTSLRCGSNANCGTGLVCCVEGTNGNYLSDCRANCNSGTRQQVCDPNAMLTGCAPGTTCSAASAGTVGLPSTYGICVSVIPH